jgi:hypothetical protein
MEGQTQAVNGRIDTSRKWKKKRYKQQMEERLLPFTAWVCPSNYGLFLFFFH